MVKTRRSTVSVYLASAATSMLGNSVAQIVWPWLVLQRTGDPAAAGLVATAVAVPSILFAFLGGYLIDSIGRKPMSVISDIISGLSLIGVILVDQRIGLDLSWFIGLGIIGAIGDVPGMAARSALVGDVSTTSGMPLEKISGMNQAIIGMTFLIGPAVAGLLISILDIELVFWITAACSLTAAALTFMLRLIPAAEDPDTKGTFTGWRAWGRIIQDPAIQLLVVVTFVSNVLVAPLLMVLLPAHFQAVDKPLFLGLSMSGYAVGMIAGGGVVTVVGTAFRRRAWTIAMLLYILSLWGTAGLSMTWAVIGGMFLAGLAGGLFGPFQMLLVTETIPEQLRGRAFSLFTALSLFAAPIGLSIATLLLQSHSIYWLAVVIAVVWTPIACVAMVRGWWIFPRYKATTEKDVTTSPTSE